MKAIFVIFDIGKTNKKRFLFNEDQQLVDELQEILPETIDEDGFPCESIETLRQWVLKGWNEILQNPEFQILGVNFSAYGASFVHLGEDGNPILPLYNYLKPYPKEIEERFYGFTGKEPNVLAVETASPKLGMLNSGLQLFWLKETHQEIFRKIKVSLHLPQYLAYLVSGKEVSDYTSVGCHTALWDFSSYKYHEWVAQSGIDHKLAPLQKSPVAGWIGSIPVGAGLHDSSAALIPYLQEAAAPFLLLSTGTWCIVLNPFSTRVLTSDLLSRDCLCYLSAEGKPVLASRIFLGKEHDYQVARIREHFKFEGDLIPPGRLPESFSKKEIIFTPACMAGTGPFPEQLPSDWDLSIFSDAAEAYFHLLLGLVDLLKISIGLVYEGEKVMYVDGGFARNSWFMEILSEACPQFDIQTREIHQATALGALLHLIKEKKLPAREKN